MTGSLGILRRYAPTEWKNAGHVPNGIYQLRVRGNHNFRVRREGFLDCNKLSEQLSVADKILVSGLIDELNRLRFAFCFENLGLL